MVKTLFPGFVGEISIRHDKKYAKHYPERSYSSLIHSHLSLANLTSRARNLVILLCAASNEALTLTGIERT